MIIIEPSMCRSPKEETHKTTLYLIMSLFAFYKPYSSQSAQLSLNILYPFQYIMESPYGGAHGPPFVHAGECGKCPFLVYDTVKYACYIPGDNARPGGRVPISVHPVYYSLVLPVCGWPRQGLSICCPVFCRRPVVRACMHQKLWASLNISVRASWLGKSCRLLEQPLVCSIPACNGLSAYPILNCEVTDHLMCVLHESRLQKRVPAAYPPYARGRWRRPLLGVCRSNLMRGLCHRRLECDLDGLRPVRCHTYLVSLLYTCKYDGNLSDVSRNKRDTCANFKENHYACTPLERA